MPAAVLKTAEAVAELRKTAQRLLAEGKPLRRVVIVVPSLDEQNTNQAEAGIQVSARNQWQAECVTQPEKSSRRG
jgi:hypothetical protein